ncbi:MFS transporter [Streptomyces sp. NPDC015131]|uniref:MFS transporter n=1 Tax=Streptomyces sp. NPDC015131 TaxID=3364941 RepID=UPI0036F856D5
MTPHRPPAPARPGALLLAACLGFVIVILDVSVVNVATGALARDLGGSLSGLEWVVNGYTLTFAAFLLTAGSLGDRFGPRHVFTAGFALFAVASLACGAAPSLVTLTAARVVQGVGAALIVPSSLSLVSSGFPDPARRTRAVGLWAAAGGFALAAGPVVGGLLVDGLGWRSVFYVNVPLAVLGIALALAYAPPAPARGRSGRRAADLPGQVLAVTGLGALTAAITEAHTLGWDSPLVLGCAAVFLVSLPAFVAVERRGADPMLPPRLFRRRAFTHTSLVGVLLNFAFYGLVFVLSVHFQQVRSYSPLTTGLALLPMTAAILAANLLCGPLVRRFGVRTVLVAGNAVAAAGFAAAVPVAGSAPYAAMAGQLAVASLGIGLVVPALTNAVLGSVDPDQAGVASGVLNASRQVGGLIGVAVMGLLMGGAATGHSASGPGAALCAATAALAVAAVLSATGVREAGASPSRAVAAGRRPVPCAGRR